MASNLAILARIEAKTDQVALVKAALIKLIEPTRAEAGCLQYDLHQDNERPEIFVFYENWRSRALWQEHMNNEHLKEYMRATEGAVADFSIHEMTYL
ncbi:MAG: putative quinol monooxygenase [Oceanospirillaceae bacterium]